VTTTKKAEIMAATTTTPFDLQGRNVLLATDGSAGSVAGARIALALATTHRATINVLNVVDTRAFPLPPAISAFAIEGAGVNPVQANEVRAALYTHLGVDVDWPVRIAFGTPASEIVAEAEQVDAAMIIVGLRRHGRVDRVLNDETALHVIRRASCPVLAVVPDTMGLPVRVLAATDFSAASFGAARAARAIAGAGAVLVLAYVPPLTALLGDEGELHIHELGVHEAFRSAVRELGSMDATIDHIVLTQEPQDAPAQMLLRYAEESNIDLIAAGSARHSRVEQWMVGSVSTELVRDGRRSVLIVPPSSRAGKPAPR
jgi:nucleotide-binding universal stress UspA family protein